MATAYVTIQSFCRRYTRAQIAQVLNIDESAVNSSTSLQEALDYGNDLVDGIARSRYSLPLREIPQRFRDMAGRAAWVRLCEDFEKLAEDQHTRWVESYDKFVEEVRSGIYDSQLRSLAQENLDTGPEVATFSNVERTGEGVFRQRAFRPGGPWSP